MLFSVRIVIRVTYLSPRVCAPATARHMLSLPAACFPNTENKIFRYGMAAISNACRETVKRFSRQAFEQCCAAGDSNKAAIMKRPR